MSAESGQPRGGSWNVLTRHDWEGQEELDTSLTDALFSLDGVGESVLYEYIDAEALGDVFGDRPDGRGASEIRFPCEDYEVRITREGTIEAREHRVGPRDGQ